MEITMKSIRLFIIVLGLLLGATLSYAQKKIVLATPRLTQELAAQWAKAYQALHPEVAIEVVSVRDAQARPTLTLTLGEDADETSLVTYVARYALLPVTTPENSRWKEFNKRRFGSKELKALFFVQDPTVQNDEEDDWEKPDKWADVNVYSSMSKQSVAATFARFFGESTTNLRGTKIAGDDIFLLKALERDPESVSFNSLSYLYDLRGRGLKNGIALLPLKLKKEQDQAFKDNNLDEILESLEEADSNAIPVEQVGLSLKALTPEVNDFLTWVIEDGQDVNHAQGFLKVDKRQARSQQEKLHYLANN